jgi:hypothetical protein
VFLDGVDCTTAVGFGQVRQTTDNHLGRAVWQLRYLPYGDWSVINRFLDRTDQGVLFVPKIPPTKPGEVAMPDPDAASLDEAHLFARYLAQREKSSAATSGITLHLWTCPEASFEAPETDLAVQGMTLVRHTARYVLR